MTENEKHVEEYKQDKESFVLITNIPVDEENNTQILQDYKKQRVIETNFEELKKPTMVSTIFLEKPERIDLIIHGADGQIKSVTKSIDTGDLSKAC